MRGGEVKEVVKERDTERERKKREREKEEREGGERNESLSIFSFFS